MVFQGLAVTFSGSQLDIVSTDWLSFLPPLSLPVFCKKKILPGNLF